MCCLFRVGRGMHCRRRSVDYGAALVGSGGDWALLGDPVRVVGDALFGGWGLGLGVSTPDVSGLAYDGSPR